MQLTVIKSPTDEMKDLEVGDVFLYKEYYYLAIDNNEEMFLYLNLRTNVCDRIARDVKIRIFGDTNIKMTIKV